VGLLLLLLPHHWAPGRCHLPPVLQLLPSQHKRGCLSSSWRRLGRPSEGEKVCKCLLRLWCCSERSRCSCCRCHCSSLSCSGCRCRRRRRRSSLCCSPLPPSLRQSLRLCQLMWRSAPCAPPPLLILCSAEGLHLGLGGGSRGPRRASGHACLPEEGSAPVANAEQPVRPLWAPGVQAQAAHLADVGAQGPVSARAAQAHEQPQVDAGPGRAGISALAAGAIATNCCQPSKSRGQGLARGEASTQLQQRSGRHTGSATASGSALAQG